MDRLVLAAAAGITAVCAACSSTSGTPTTEPTTTIATSHPATTPAAAGSSSSATSVASQPAAHADGAAGWCGELKAAGQSMISGGLSAPSAAQQAEAQRLIADAPTGIRPDLQALWHTETSGHADTPATMQAAAHVAQWLQSNCPSVFAGLNPSAPPTG